MLVQSSRPHPGSLSGTIDSTNSTEALQYNTYSYPTPTTGLPFLSSELLPLDSSSHLMIATMSTAPSSFHYPGRPVKRGCLMTITTSFPPPSLLRSSISKLERSRGTLNVHRSFPDWHQSLKLHPHSATNIFSELSSNMVYNEYDDADRPYQKCHMAFI